MSHKKPTALRLLHGNPGKRPINKKEPRFAGSASCPSWLSPVAKKEWKRIYPMLEEAGILQGTDQSQLAAYCQSYADWKEAVEHVRKEGQVITVETFTRAGIKNGSKNVVNPWIKLAGEHQKAMLKAASLFGMDPVNRSRIEATSIMDEDDMPDELDGDDGT